jgi:Ni,Fe-hydrogenase III large subunit
MNAQQPAEPRPEPSAEEQPDGYEFFSGQIAAVSREKLTVVRTVSNGGPEQRTFRLTAETRIEGKLKVRSRVTVGYQTSEAGDVATRVIVRRR